MAAEPGQSLCLAGCGFFGGQSGFCSKCAPPHPTPGQQTLNPTHTAHPECPLHRLVLLGDSTLDNVLWVQEAAQPASVAACLQQALGAGTPLHNLAADGYTTRDVLEGGEAVLSRAMRRAQGDPFPATARPGSSPAFFAPLEALAALPDGGKSATLVLSVGGNVSMRRRQRARSIATHPTHPPCPHS